jgi:hypothetical protein
LETTIGGSTAVTIGRGNNRLRKTRKTGDFVARPISLGIHFDNTVQPNTNEIIAVVLNNTEMKEIIIYV